MAQEKQYEVTQTHDADGDYVFSPDTVRRYASSPEAAIKAAIGVESLIEGEVYEVQEISYLGAFKVTKRNVSVKIEPDTEDE